MKKRLAVLVLTALAVMVVGCGKDEGVVSRKRGASSPEELGTVLAKAIIEFDKETAMSFIDESAKYDRALNEEIEQLFTEYDMDRFSKTNEPVKYDDETARKRRKAYWDAQIGGRAFEYSTSVEKPGSLRFSEPGMLEIVPRLKIAGSPGSGIVLTNPLICQKLDGKWVLVGKNP